MLIVKVFSGFFLPKIRFNDFAEFLRVQLAEFLDSLHLVDHREDLLLVGLQYSQHFVLVFFDLFLSLDDRFDEDSHLALLVELFELSGVGVDVLECLLGV